MPSRLTLTTAQIIVHIVGVSLSVGLSTLLLMGHWGYALALIGLYGVFLFSAWVEAA